METVIFLSDAELGDVRPRYSANKSVSIVDLDGLGRADSQGEFQSPMITEQRLKSTLDDALV